MFQDLYNMTDFSISAFVDECVVEGRSLATQAILRTTTVKCTKIFFRSFFDLSDMEEVLLNTSRNKRTRAQRQARKRLQDNIVFSNDVEPVADDSMLSTPNADDSKLSPPKNALKLSELTLQSFTGTCGVVHEYIKGIHKSRSELDPDSLLGRFMNLTGDQDEIVDLLECQLIFAYLMWNARTAMDKTIALAVYAKLVNTQIADYIIPIVALTSAWDWLTKDDDLNVQSFEFPTMPDMRSFLDYYDSMKGSKMYEKLYKFCMYGLSLSLFKPVGIDMDYMKYDTIAQNAIKNKYHMGVDFCYTILDTCLFLCERGYQCFATGSIQPIFHSELKYQKWFDKAEKLSRESHFLANPAVHGIDRFSYLSDLKDIIEQGKSMQRLTPRKEDKLMIGKMLTTLELVHDTELTKRASQKDRPAPFCILLYGGSSVGKSTLTNLLFQHYGKVRKLNTSSEFKYVRNPTEEFWSNFNSTQWCIIMDDIGFMAPQLGVMDPSLAEMLCVANYVPFVPAQAELQDKGRTPVRAELVIGSTNTESLNLHAYFSCPLAVQRRFPYVLDIRPKPEFSDPLRPQMLDSSRVPTTPEGEYPDLWIITLKKVVPAGTERNHQQGVLEDVTTFTSMRDLIKWYTKAIIDHNHVQDKVALCGKTMAEVKVCDACQQPQNWCDCLTPQSSEVRTGLMDICYAHNALATQSLEFINHDGRVDDFELFGPYDDSLLGTFNSYLMSWEWYQRTIINYYLMWYVITSRYQWLALLCAWWWGEGWFMKWLCTSQHKALIARVVFGYMGRRAYYNFNPSSKLVKLGFAIAGILTVYKGVSKLRNYFRSETDQKDTVVPDPLVREMLKEVKESKSVYYGPDDIPDQGDVESNAAYDERVYQTRLARAKLQMVVTPQEVLALQGARSSIDVLDIKCEPTQNMPADYVYRHPYTDEYALSSADLTPSTACSKGRDPEPLMRQIESATVSFRSLSEGIMRVTTAVNVRGSVYMCNYHALPKEGSFLLDVISSDSEIVNTNSVRLLVTPNMVHRIPEHDLAFVHLKCRPPAKDLTGFFTLPSYVGKLEGTYIGRSYVGKSWRLAVHGLHQRLERWMAHDTVVSKVHWRGKVATPTNDGDCGMLLFSNTPAGHMILGVHTLGKDSIVSTMRVTQDTVIKGCDFLEPKFINSGVVEVSAPSKERWLSFLSPQSVMKGMRGTANPIGSFIGEFRQRPRTCVAATAICASMLKRGYELQKTKPDMGRKPWKMALNDMTRPVVLLRNDVLDECVRSFISDTSEASVSEIRVYSMSVAMNGKAGVRYCDKLPRNTSAGCPYKCPKKRFLHHVDSPEGEDWVMPSKEIVDECNKIITTYERGDRYHPVFCGHLKDEPVTFKKAADGKTRVFTASPMAWTIVVRMYLMGVIMHIQNNRFLYECGPGVVAQSLEWEEIRDFLVKHGRGQIVAGDYEKFDKRMPANVILAAFHIIYEACVRAGYTDKQLRVVLGIMYDTAFPNVDFNGDLVEFLGSNPSGHPLTVIINGLANCLYMRYCYTILNPLKTCATFRLHVSLMTYGDDNIMGVSKEAPWFNHTSIVGVLAEIDIGYTMADKEAPSVPYIDIDDSNFLKRTWVFDKDIGAYVARLDHASIEKMTTVCVMKGNISPQEHAIAVISTAVREYFWYGRAIFEEKKEMFLQIVDENDLTLCVEDSTFPTWEELYQDFWDRSTHVNLDRLK